MFCVLRPLSHIFYRVWAPLIEKERGCPEKKAPLLGRKSEEDMDGGWRRILMARETLAVFLHLQEEEEQQEEEQEKDQEHL